MQQLFNRFDQTDKDLHRQYIKCLQNVGVPIYFFGLKGSEPAYLAIPIFVMGVLFKCNVWLILGGYVAVWGMIYLIRSTCPRDRLRVAQAKIVLPPKKKWVFPKKEVLERFDVI